MRMVYGPPMTRRPSIPKDLAQRVLTVDEAAALLRIGRTATYDAIRRGEVPSIRVGRRLRVPGAALARLLETAGR
jgi:excisionase family DNA binding protein